MFFEKDGDVFGEKRTPFFRKGDVQFLYISVKKIDISKKCLFLKILCHSLLLVWHAI